MAITALPTPPTRDDADNFAQRADAFLSALPAFAEETNAVAAAVQGNAAICQSAAMVVSVSAWVSGTTYADGAAVYDTTDYLTYRRKGAGAGTTRPGLDAANWQLLTGFGNVTLDTNQTITGVKTFTQTIQGSVSGNAATADSASNCTRQVLAAGLASGGGALTANRTITVTEAATGDAQSGTGTGVMTARRTAEAIAAQAPAVVNTMGTIASQAAGAVGTYGFMRLSNGAGQVNPGDLVSGAVLQYSNRTGDYGGAVSGTWRCCGFTLVGDRGTLYLRAA